jgi:hypothetical protein
MNPEKDNQILWGLLFNLVIALAVVVLFLISCS